MSEFTMCDESGEPDIEKMFEGFKKYIRETTKEKGENGEDESNTVQDRTDL